MRVRQRGGERGSALLLFPAVTLVMFMLAAMVIDVALVQLRVRELEAVAAAAANDALAALDIDALRAGEGLVLPLGDVSSLVAQSLRAGPLPSARIASVDVALDAAGRTVIEVTLSYIVDLVMTPAVAGYGQATIVVTERAIVLGSEAF